MPKGKKTRTPIVLPNEQEQPWDLPTDKWWIKPYLTYVRAGHTDIEACAMVGIDNDTPHLKAKKDSEFSERVARAKREGRHRVVVECRQIAIDQARKGSTWHWAKIMAWADPALYKAICKTQHEAEPNRFAVDVANGVSFADLLKDADNGGFAHGAGSDSPGK
mgnify:CR=1 FL=1